MSQCAVRTMRSHGGASPRSRRATSSHVRHAVTARTPYAGHLMRQDPSVARPIVIVGGGPAGLMAADILATAGEDLAITIHERMPSAGRKFQLAGRGGLNLTHSEPLDRLLDRYGDARTALEPSIRAFDPSAVRAWSDGLGQRAVVGTSGRVFPEAFRATPLLRAWLRRLDGAGVALRTRSTWLGWDEAGRPRFRDDDDDVAADAD